VGAVLPLPQSPAGPGVGLSDVPLPLVGEGYTVEAPAQPLQVTVPHGSPVHGLRPSYAADEVGGVGWQAGRAEPVIPVLVGTRSQPGAGVDVISLPSRPGRWRGCWGG
jgi:hypothetical protein